MSSSSETPRRRSGDRAPPCLFPSEQEISEYVLGAGRLREWRALAIVLERSGLPKVDPILGGRYWPAVRAWFDARAGIGKSLHAVSDVQESGPKNKRFRL